MGDQRQNDSNKKGDDSGGGDEQPTTSKLTTGVEQTAHNMKDLKTLDFNSADEIRQTMKAVLSGKVPHQVEEAISKVKQVNSDIKLKADTDQPANTEPNNEVTIGTDDIHNSFECINQKNDVWDPKVSNIRKRPGRPPKAGTSKKVKNESVTAMYKGKLSNVVAFKRRRNGCRSRSESEDSLVIFF